MNKDRSKMEDMIRHADVRFTKEISSNLQHFIKSLLQVEIAMRLGSNGPTEIMEHPWLKKVNFEKVINKV